MAKNNPIGLKMI